MPPGFLSGVGGAIVALRKVYASFYNRNAFLERLRRGVNENEVGMAVLVHHSFPDETEMANGVGLFQRETFSDVVDLVTIFEWDAEYLALAELQARV